MFKIVFQRNYYHPTNTRPKKVIFNGSQQKSFIGERGHVLAKIAGYIFKSIDYSCLNSSAFSVLSFAEELRMYVEYVSMMDLQKW